MAHVAQSRNVIRHVVSRGKAFHKSENAIHHPLLFACQGVRYRKLEVILTTGIEKLGKGGETVKVAPGYFRNHLMPKLLAVPNIDKYAHLIREQRKMRNFEEKEEVKVVHKTSEVQTKEFEKAAKRLANANLVLRKLIDKEKFKNRSSKEDKPDVQTPVTKEEIVSEVARQLCVKIDPDNVVLTEPLTTFGEYEVPLKFPKTIPLPPATVQWILRLKHPNWNMGKKITVDSATLFNKGLEVIEAHYLFGAEYDDIEIVIHPQSIIHSMIETQDSSVLAQLGWPDMRLPILYTMSWPDRVPCSEVTWPRLDLCKLGSLTFKKPDNVKYPSMDLAYAAGRAGGTMTGVLSAANEKAVEMFIDEKISYLDIFKAVELTCDKHRNELVSSPSLEEIVHYDLWAREYAANVQLSSGARPVPA